ncbi:hypothetical protein BC830DRAFT_1082690 [Chytriomyces sp. MP71]|nr:hypothetical protein BC830DRAFT_1082690 [Chytriomyces sp. MP71]
MLGLRKYSLVCLTPGGVRCVKPKFIADEWDHGNSMKDMLQHMELQMMEAQCANEAKEARFLRTLSKKDDCIASLIAQVSELSSQLTTAMQQFFQDAPREHHSHEDAGSLQPQQSPPAAQSLCQILQEGPYTQHEDNATHTEAASYTSASRTASTPSPSAPPAQGASAAAATSTCTCKEQTLLQAAQDVIHGSNSGQ